MNLDCLLSTDRFVRLIVSPVDFPRERVAKPRPWLCTLNIVFAITFVNVATLLFATSANANGGSATWNGSQNNNWIPSQNGGNQNWSTGNHNFPGTVNTTTNTDTATFNISGGNPTITLNPSLISGGTTLNLQNITFDTASVGAFTIGTTGGPTLRLTNAGTIQMTSTVANSETINAPIELEPASPSTSGSYTFLNNASNSTRVLTFGGAISGGTTSSSITLTLSGTNTGANTVSGVISNGNATGGMALTKAGSGTWTLSGANSYTGLTTVSAGTLAEGVSNAIGTGALTVNGATAIFDLGASHSDTVGTVTLDGGGSITGTGTSTLTSTGSFEMKSGSVSAILGGSVALNKTTSGTVTLSGANTYTGATLVSGGKLLVTGSLASGSAVTVNNSGSVLGGTGTINGTVTINSGAAILGGTGSTGQTLTVANNLTLSSGSIIELALGPSLAHSTLARTAGTWSFDSAQHFAFTDLGATTGTYQDIITGLASDPGTGSWTIDNPGWTGAFTYDGTGNIDLTLTAVPEPSTWIGGALALLAVGCTQRKRFARFFKRA